MTLATAALTLSLGTTNFAQTAKKEVVWTPTFYAIQPRTDVKHPVSKEFCLTHIPNTLRTTISQIKNGVQAENGVYIKYLSYTTTHKSGLGFNIVNAVVWTADAKGNKTWSSPMKEYQQNLSDTGVTNTVWSTDQCKGKFIGVSNVD
ncbi:hypothetical protein BGC07_10385 [Piscirickettsia litoralis]|uniref:Uncharacterized protein n=1 Tax=Piscirickettsia litoralis TaxID=1891921 RepID=A0ABX3A692_9GAMM|nr:hypothetical protein BGC07_10385 [Piscirickettsia litoralis]